MLYTYEYDPDYIPAMPVVKVMIGRAQLAPTLPIRAIIDSGADATMIPISYLKQIGARKGKQVIVRSYLGKRDPVTSYVISLQFANFAHTQLSVVGVVQTMEAVIGRHILNASIVTLNGLASSVEVSA